MSKTIVLRMLIIKHNAQGRSQDFEKGGGGGGGSRALDYTENNQLGNCAVLVVMVVLSICKNMRKAESWDEAIDIPIH